MRRAEHALGSQNLRLGRAPGDLRVAGRCHDAQGRLPRHGIIEPSCRLATKWPWSQCMETRPDKSESWVRVAKVTSGLVMLPVGAALLVLPGPGIPVVLGGLALLKDEFGWAKHALRGASHLAQHGRDWLQDRERAKTG